MKSLGPGLQCGAVGISGGSEVIVKKRSWNFRAWHWSPTDLRGLLLVHVYRKPLQGENKEIWALCGQLLHTARYASQRREKACGQECMYATTSCPRHRMGLEYQHSSRRIRHRTNMKHTHRHALQHAHTHTHTFRQVYGFVTWIRLCHVWGSFFPFQLTFAEESLKAPQVQKVTASG